MSALRPTGDPARALRIATGEEDPSPLPVIPAPRNGTDPATPELTYRSTRLADVVAERVRWLWSGRLPLGKLVVLDGDPSVGKSTLTLDLTARVTTGRPLPDEELALVPPSAVVLMSAEDGLADTIRPRLDAAGADTAKVHHFDAVARVDDDGNTRWVPPSIPGDLAALEALVVATGAVLVVVDVLMAYLSSTSNSYRDQDVRGALAPLAAMADRTGATVLLLRHLTKQLGPSAIYRGGGSIGIVGAARAGLVAAPDPEDDTGARRILAPTKSNLAAAPSALAYTLTDSPDHGCAVVRWLGRTAHQADALVTGPVGEHEPSAVDEAVEWLRHALADGPVPSAVLIKRAAADGISKPTLHRAKKPAGVASEKRGAPGTGEQEWRWALTVSDAPHEGTHVPEGAHSPDRENLRGDNALTCGNTRSAPPADPEDAHTLSMSTFGTDPAGEGPL